MRIGLNARYLYDPSLRGFNRYSLCLLRALQDLPGPETYLLSEQRYPVHEVFRSVLRAEVRNLPSSRTLYWEQWVLPRYIKRLGLDVFHAPADGGLPLHKVCPYVLTYHGVPDRSLASLVNSGELPGALEDYLDVRPKGLGLASAAVHTLKDRVLPHAYLRVADLVITVSQFSKLELVRFMGISPDKIRVIYEAADEVFAEPLPAEHIQQVLAKYGIPPRFVLFVGGFDKRKNVSTLLTAFTELKKEHRDVALILVGIGGDIEGCRAQSTAASLQFGEDVLFLHRVSDSDLAALYRAASLFTTLSWHEGFCLPVVEAMACGTPVLASSFGAIPEVLGGAGWLVDPRCVDQVVSGMQALLGQPELRDELRARSLARSKLFSWERTAQETLAAYMDVL